VKVKTMNLNESLGEGHFARKQIFCKDRLIAWAHRSRFEIGLELARSCAGQNVLDYGCGDGTFLAMLMTSSRAPARAIGAELGPDSVRDSQVRLGSPGKLDFICIDDLNASTHDGAYDTIFCMEVLEHVVELEPVLDQFVRLLAPAGKLYISVPVETGVPMVVKQLVRQIAGWRGIGDYPGMTPYTMREYLASVFAGQRQHIARPIHINADGSVFHDHKGFNWAALRGQLALRFQVERQISSPLPWLPAHLASQVWFLVSKREH